MISIFLWGKKIKIDLVWNLFISYILRPNQKMNPAHMGYATRNYDTLEEMDVCLINGVLVRVSRRTEKTVWIRRLGARQDKDIDVWMSTGKPDELRAARFKCFTHSLAEEGNEERLSRVSTAGILHSKGNVSFRLLHVWDIVTVARCPYIYVWGDDAYEEHHIVEPRLPHHFHDENGVNIMRIPWVPEPPRPYRAVVNMREVNEHMERHFAEPVVPVQPPNA